jgi:ubiquinone/menaquinone biosynthesis C-methylase UbiE
MDEQTRKQLGVEENKPNDWFETLYSGSNEGGAGVPWANMSTHPVFKGWVDEHTLDGKGKTALVVGCGLGDDAIALEKLGFTVTAFDVAESAIDLCNKRFPDSTVDFVQADLIAGIPEWHHKFDFVLEIFTIQAFPPNYEQTLIANLSRFVAENGELMVITEIRKGERDFKIGPPWLLNYDYMKSFEQQGLHLSFLTNDPAPTMGEECHLSVFKRV